MPSDGRLRMIAARNQTFASYLSLKLSVLRKASTSPEKSLSSLIMPCSRALFNVRNRAVPTSDCIMHDVGSSYRSMDLEVLTAKGQCHTAKFALAVRCARRQFSVDSQLQSQAASETHVALFRPSWKRKPFLIFVFQIWSRRMLIDEFRMLWLPWATHRKVWHKMEVWTATRAGWPSKRPFCAILFYASPRATKACETRLYGRNDAPGPRVIGAKLRLHQVFWSQNLAFQSQNATMRPDFSSPDSIFSNKSRHVAALLQVFVYV